MPGVREEQMKLRLAYRFSRRIWLCSWLVIGMSIAASAVAADKISVYQGGDQPGHYLYWNGKPLLLIGDSVTQGWMESGQDFNQTGYVDALASRGINVLLLWSFIGTDSAKQRVDSRLLYDAPELWPWAGSTDAKTINLLAFNQAYFDRLKDLAAYAERKGVAVVITVHDGWTKDRLGQHPYNSANGNGPLTANSQFVELADYDHEMGNTYNAAWTRQQKNQFFQEQFAAKLISELDPYSNVMYEMFNEGEWYNHTQRRRHEQHFLAFFRARCKNLLFSNTDHITGDSPQDDAKVDVVALHNTPWTGKFGVYQSGFNTRPAKPYFEEEPVPEFDGGNLSMETIRLALWERALAGAGFVNQNDASFGWNTNTAIVSQAASRDLAYDHVGHCCRFFNAPGAEVEFWNMQPSSALASTGLCLAKAGVEYVVYSPTGASFTVNLSTSTNFYTVRWYNPRTDQTSTHANVRGGAVEQIFKKPDSHDWVLHLKVTSRSAAAPEVPAVIFDTDMGSDCDDAGALAVLHALADAGEVRILGVIFSSGKNRFGVGTCDAINTYYGRGDLPLGQYKGKDVGDPTDSYTKRIATDTNRFSHDLTDEAPDLVSVYCRILESQPDHSVTILTVGHPHGLVHLMRDARGMELVRAKVDRWVAMGMGGWNFEQCGMSAYCGELLKNWPMPFYISPVGADVITGNRLLPKTPAANPVREAYRLWRTALVDGRSSWDQVATLFVARPALFKVENRGRVERTPHGSIVWNADVDNPKHHRVTPTISNSEMAGLIEELMARHPKERTTTVKGQPKAERNEKSGRP